MRTAKILSFALILPFACLGVWCCYQNFPWIWRKAAIAAMGLPTPPASAFYVFNISNSTSKPLIVSIINLNDRHWRIYTPSEARARSQLNWITETQIILPQGKTNKIVLPSIEHKSLGMILVTARTDYEYTPDLSQRIALFLIGSGQTFGRNFDQEATYPTLVIHESDLTMLSGSEVSTDVIEEVIKKLRRNATTIQQGQM